MGAFYRHALVVGATLEAVRAAWPSVPALIAPVGEVVLVFWADGSGRVEPGVAEITPVELGALSAATGAAVLAFDVHDSDILTAMGWRAGAALFEFSLPDPTEYFDFGLDEETLAALQQLDTFPALRDQLAEHVPELGDLFTSPGATPGSVDATPPNATAIVAALGFGDADAVRNALTGDVVFAEDRQRDLLTALGLPVVSVGWGYEYLQREGFAALSGIPVEEIGRT